MAKRSRNHVLEDKSRLAFSSVLPDTWVARDKDKDYGIDCEVEIFDESGNSTGLFFWVQLKATESKKDYVIKNIAFSQEKINQFHSYNIPILIVRYSHIDGVLYYVWADDITSHKKTDEKVILRFSEQKILSKDIIEGFESYLIRYHYAKSSNLDFPLQVFISKNLFEKQVDFRIVQYWKNIILKNDKYFKLVRNELDSTLQVWVGTSKTYFSFSDICFSSIGYDDVDLKEANQYYNDAFLSCVSILLYSSNKKLLADTIFWNNSLLDIVKLREDFLFSFLPHLIEGDRYEFILNSLHEMFDVERDNNLQNFILILLHLSQNFGSERKDAIERFLTRQMEYSKSVNFKIGIAAANYNLGNFYRNSGDFVKALNYYKKARKLNPEYGLQGYFFHEVGGVLFELKYYKLAVNYYRRALEFKSNDYRITKALLGDALLFSGKYEEALLVFDEYLTEQANEVKVNNDEWHLKYSCIHSLILSGFPKDQIRRPEEAIQLIRASEIDKAVDADMLCAEAWYQNGLIKNDSRVFREAYLSFALAAILNKNDYRSWVLATILAFSTDESLPMAACVIRLAYYYHNEKYYDDLSTILLDNMTKIHDDIMNLVDKIISEQPSEELKLRFFWDENEVETISFKR